MSKKQETKTKVEPTPQVIKQPKVETPVVETPKPKKDSWEIKDRIYYLKGNQKPLSRLIKSSNIFYFDKEKRNKRKGRGACC